MKRPATEVTFKPSPATFTKTEFEYAILEKRLRELAFLNSGLRIRLYDERHAPVQTADFCFDGGLIQFVRFLDRSKTPVLSEPLAGGVDGAGGIRVEFALSWNDSFHETSSATPTTSRSATAAATWPAIVRRSPGW